LFQISNLFYETGIRHPSSHIVAMTINLTIINSMRSLASSQNPLAVFRPSPITGRVASHGFCKQARAQKVRLAGFSLVEIMIAMGVVSFSFITLMGLLGVGAVNFHKANTTSITTQIAQQVINQAQQSDFSDLITPQGQATPSTTAFTNAVRYFDDAGNEIINSAEYKNAVYQVNTRITPATLLPQSGAPAPTTNPCLATVTVQVANNPGGATLPTQSAAPLQYLWAVGTTPSISTFSTFVSQNK
jgi:uncharacterized protein (TIGR02598 family)